MVEHLGSIGVRAEMENAASREVRRREEGQRVRLRQLAEFRVWLKKIESIEVWRETRKVNNESVAEDEITYVVAFEPGVSLSRIPVLTNTVVTHTRGGEVRFHWRGFEWGRVPLLEGRLKGDKGLNRRLLGYIRQDMASDLRIRALSGERVGITTGYNPTRLPSRGFLDCIEEIAQHVNDYVAERNREREEEGAGMETE